MVIWLQHPEHGKYPAQQSEVDALKKSGWTICPPKKATLTLPKKGLNNGDRNDPNQ